MAEERLLHLANEHRFSRQPTYQDVLWQAAAEVILNTERLYYEGRLDMALCGMPQHNPDAEPVALMDKIASEIAIDIGGNNYTLLAKTCIDALVEWASAHPVLDDDESTPTRHRWERGTDRHTLAERSS
jgi:hypothetical protein